MGFLSHRGIKISLQLRGRKPEEFYIECEYRILESAQRVILQPNRQMRRKVKYDYAFLEARVVSVITFLLDFQDN